MNDENLKNGVATQFVAGETQARIARNGAIAANKAKRAKKNLSSFVSLIANAPTDEKTAKGLAKQLGIEDDEITNNAVFAVKVFKNACSGRNGDKYAKLWHDMTKDAEGVDNRNDFIYRTDLYNIADVYHPVIRDIRDSKHREYISKGGRGSAKSSTFPMITIELLLNNPTMHALAVRKVSNTLRDSIYAQFLWALDKHSENPLFNRSDWETTVSPMEITYKPTGQKIYFRGADDPAKIKSIKPKFGYIGVILFEELDQFSGQEEIRNITQSAIRGGDLAYIFKMFNPPIQKNNWANIYASEPDEKKIVIHTTYKDVPREWLGDPFIEEAEHLKEVNEKAYRHEYLGESIGVGADIFTELEIRDITDDEIASYEYIYQGQDWGWFPDPKAFVRVAYDRKHDKIICIAEDGGQKLKVSDMAKRIKKRGFDDFPVYCGRDEMEHIDDMRDAGVNAYPADMSPGSVRRTFEWLQCRTLVIDPKRTPNLYREVINYQRDIDKATGEPIDSYPDRNDHWISGLRYATSPISMRRGSPA